MFDWTLCCVGASVFLLLAVGMRLVARIGTVSQKSNSIEYDHDVYHNDR